MAHNPLHDAYLQGQERQRLIDRERQARTVYGVFVWHPGTIYPEAEAVRVFLREFYADNFVHRAWERKGLEYVVRKIVRDPVEVQP